MSPKSPPGEKRQRELDQAVLDVVEREHQRFACDLHDGICQELTGITMMLESLVRSLPPTFAEELLPIARHIRQVTTDARRLALGLAPLAVERAGLAGALALLKFDVERLRGPQITLVASEPASRSLRLDAAVDLYRIAQEAVANAVRHSGASQIDITFGGDETSAFLRIRDNGGGVPSPAVESGGLGLRSMALRAERLSGRLELSSDASRGTSVEVTIPNVS